MNDGCGPSFSEFARYSDRDGYWVKMSGLFSQRLMLWDDEADCLEVYSETWPRSAIVSSTTAYRLPVLARSTGETGSGSSVGFPTPTANPPGWKNIEVVDKDGTLPTHPNQRFYNKATGQKVQTGLEQVVRMFPTPTSRDWKDTPGMALESVNPDGSRRDRTDLLPRRIYADLPKDQDRPSGSLNPTWVEWLMGYPLGWTDLDHSETQ